MAPPIYPILSICVPMAVTDYWTPPGSDSSQLIRHSVTDVLFLLPQLSSIVPSCT